MNGKLRLWSIDGWRVCVSVWVGVRSLLLDGEAGEVEVERPRVDGNNRTAWELDRCSLASELAS